MNNGFAITLRWPVVFHFELCWYLENPAFRHEFISDRRILYMKRFLVAWFFGLTCLSATAKGDGLFLPAEKAVLELLSRDTTEQVVTVMPMSYRFGLRDMAFDRISILKLGGRILLLPDGQDAVFQWRPDLGKLVRIDSSRFSGSNFGMMPFIRKGQAWQFGGYGFWRSRDMFTRFDERRGQWTFECSDPSVTGHLTLNFYDPGSDVFYMCGSFRNRPHEMHRTDFSDGVYRFDFRDRKWSRLGKIALVSNPTELINALHLRNTAVLGSGLIHVMGSQTTLYDFGHNIYSRIREGSDTALLRMGVQSGQYDKSWEHCIKMGDSMYIIHANDNEVRVNTLYLHPRMFEKIGQIWVTEERTNVLSSNVWQYALIIIAFLSVLVIGWYSLKKFNFIKYFNYGRGRSSPSSDVVEHAEWSVFWKGLRSGHQLLLRHMVFDGDPLKGVDTDTLNLVLGLSRRPASLQKVHRNRAVQSINQVYQQTFRTESLLIGRLKDSYDRRQHRFYISEENIEMIRKHISSLE